MKEIQKVVQKLSRGQEAAAAAQAVAYEPVQKHKVTPGIPGWLNKIYCIIEWHKNLLMNCYITNVPVTN